LDALDRIAAVSLFDLPTSIDETGVKFSRAVSVAVLAGLIGVGLYYVFVRQTTPTEGSAVTSVKPALPSALRGETLPQTGVNQSKADEAEPVDRTAQAESTSKDYAKTFREASDYHDFILGALAAAQKGDPDAAYYLSSAIAYCDETNRFFFRRGDKTLGVDQAIADRARFPGISMTEAIRRADRRCHDVNGAVNPGWGKADEWLARAAEAGQPAALVKSAGAALLAISMSGAAEARAPGSHGPPMNVSQARAQMLIGLESKDPEAVYLVAEMIGALKPDWPASELDVRSLTWRYAACIRGADCSSDAEWYFQTCLFDPGCFHGESGLDYLRRAAVSMNVYDIEQRANELGAKIDAQAWDELGIGG
jgi:TPR repeat protein